VQDFSDDHLKGSAVRLWDLVAQRARPEADTDAIDARIWDLFGEDWAVLFTDLAGFSRQVERFGIVHFLQIIWEQKQLLLPIVAAHDGILIKVEADSFLILFRRAERALDCAIAMQQACREENHKRLPEERILLCVGLGFGRLLRIGDEDVFGAEVNAASKLGEDRAKQDEILITQAVKDAVEGRAGVSFEKLEMEIPGTAGGYRVGY
jgi:adenylate cyclase